MLSLYIQNKYKYVIYIDVVNLHSMQQKNEYKYMTDMRSVIVNDC